VNVYRTLPTRGGLFAASGALLRLDPARARIALIFFIPGINETIDARQTQ
jgi:hypothetical protein